MGDPGVNWRLQGDAADLACGPLGARVEFASALTGVRPNSWRGQAIAPAGEFSVLSTSGPSAQKIAEPYIRGQDLVVTLAKQPPFFFAPSIYWRSRLHSALAAAQIEMILSIQTDLLDSRPQSTVQSALVNCRAFHARALAAEAFQEVTPASGSARFAEDGRGEHLFLFRDAARGFSYAEMTHPSDFFTAVIDGGPQPGDWRLTWALFPHHLEKGVIRRGLVSGWFLPVENDLAAAAQLAREFVREPPPLTA
jgi:hypothetical protein